MATRIGVRRLAEESFQRFSVPELALTVSRKPEQLSFAAFVDDERCANLLGVKADPKGARSTRLFDPGTPIAYRCIQTATLPTVRFCWTIFRNAAGRFLTFRERTTRNRIVRDQIEAILDKRAAIAACRINRDAFDAKRAKARSRRLSTEGAIR